jgi:hypothetical protein
VLASDGASPEAMAVSVAARSYTRSYQAPGEEGVLTSSSDLYAVGVTIQELVEVVRGRTAGDLEEGAMAKELLTLATALMSSARVNSTAGTVCDGSMPASPAVVARAFIDRMMVALTPTSSRTYSNATAESGTPPQSIPVRFTACDSSCREPCSSCCNSIQMNM